VSLRVYLVLFVGKGKIYLTTKYTKVYTKYTKVYTKDTKGRALVMMRLIS